MNKFVLFVILLICTIATADTISFAGPSDTIPDNSYLFTGTDGKTPCKLCTIDCTEFITKYKIFSTCSHRYYNYGCNIEAQCATAQSASRAEIVAAIGFCYMFNNCSLAAQQGSRWELSLHVNKIFDANVKDLFIRNMTYYQVRAGILYLIPPSFYLDVFRAQVMKTAIVSYGVVSYADLSNNEFYRKQWYNGFQRLVAEPTIYGALALDRSSNQPKFYSILNQIKFQNYPAIPITAEDITLAAIKNAADNKYKKYQAANVKYGQYTAASAKKQDNVDELKAAYEAAMDSYKSVKLNFRQSLVSSLEYARNFMTAQELINAQMVDSGTAPFQFCIKTASGAVNRMGGEFYYNNTFSGKFCNTFFDYEAFCTPLIQPQNLYSVTPLASPDYEATYINQLIDNSKPGTTKRTIADFYKMVTADPNPPKDNSRGRGGSN